MDERTRRLALNEVIFRRINEEVEGLARTWSKEGVRQEYFCECSNLDCGFRIPLTVPEYEHVRSCGTWFLVAPGHALPDIEDVIEEHPGHWIVGKRDDTGEFVAMLDPRNHKAAD